MREIKFRGFTEADKKWVYGNLIEKDGVYWILEKVIGCYSKNRRSNIYDCLGGRFRFELHKIEEKSLGQFTGLKDINENEIYEGDIVNFIVGDISTKYVVAYKDSAFILKAKNKTYKINKNDHEYIKVVGNIFKNLELLEKSR